MDDFNVPEMPEFVPSEEPVNEVTNENISDMPVKKKRGRRKNAKVVAGSKRSPSFKNWVCVQKSAGNGMPNVQIKLVINQATNVCTLFTNAFKQEGSEELEGERKQVFKFTEFIVIDDPNNPGEPTENEEPPVKSEETEPTFDPSMPQ